MAFPDIISPYRDDGRTLLQNQNGGKAAGAG